MLTKGNARVVAESLEHRICLSLPPLDPSFGAGGVVDTGINFAGGFVRLPDQRFLVSGVEDEKFPIEQFYLSRLNADGTYDAGFRASLFGESGEGFSRPTDFALQSDGKIVVVGAVGGGPTETPFAIGRFNADGTPDATFAGDGVRVIHSTFPPPPWWSAENPPLGQFNAVAI